jgi:hypothetical protein
MRPLEASRSKSSYATSFNKSIEGSNKISKDSTDRPCSKTEVDNGRDEPEQISKKIRALVKSRVHNHDDDDGDDDDDEGTAGIGISNFGCSK